MPSAKVLLFDDLGSDLLIPLLENEQVNVLAIRGGGPTYLRAWIESRFNFIFSPGLTIWENYLLSCIDQCSSKIVISFNDNHPFFLKLETLRPDLVTVAIQNGWRAPSNNNDSLFNAEGFKSVTYALVFNAAVGLKYTNELGADYLSIGSLRNNSCPKKNQKEDQEASGPAIISEWRPGMFDQQIQKGVALKEYYQEDPFVFGVLAEWASERGLAISIVGCAIDPDLQGDEYNYFKSMFSGAEIRYVARTDLYSSYSVLDRYRMAISMDSTLGYESISRGNRVSFLSCRKAVFGRQFGWPENFPTEGSFWSNTCTFGRIREVLDFVWDSNDSEWIEEISPIVDKVMQFDENNSILKKWLQDLAARH